MNPQEYCTGRAAPAGSSVYYATLFHSIPERRALHACFAFLTEILRDLASIIDPTATGRRLLWWREELGAGRMAVSPHPLLVELRSLPIAPAEVTAQLEPGVICALEELAGWQPETDVEWHAHCRDLHAGAWQLAARACSVSGGAGVMDRIGTLAALSGQLQQVLELAPRVSAARCPLPRMLLQNHRLDTAAGPALMTSAGLMAAIREIVSALHDALLQCARPGTDCFGELPQFCRVLHVFNLALCGKLLRQPELLLTERVTLSPLGKLWLAWRQRR